MRNGKSAFAFSNAPPATSLQERETLHRFLAEHSNDFVTLYDLEGKRVYASAAFIRTLGSPTAPIFHGLHPEDRARADAAWRRARQGEEQSLSYRHRDVDGAWRSLEATLKPVMFRGKAHVLALSRDTTERNALEEQLRHAQKMEALGRLAGGVAHDFNNLLTAINGYAELALQDVTPDSDACDSIREIKLAAERAGRVTRQLLTFSRREPRRPRLIDVAAVAGGLESMLRLLLGEDVGLRIKRPQERLPVCCDPVQLEQVIVNLVSNARDASRPGSLVRMECDAVVVADRTSRVPAYVRAGPYVRIRVTDTGTGMSPETASRAFEPFFTTKPAGVGTGLGLSTVFGIIKQAAGFVWIESEPDAGTAVHVLLPRADGEMAEPAAAVSARDPVSLAGLTIAVVEDDELVRKLAELALRRAGAEVLAFASGGEALRALVDTSLGVDLMVTDVVLPGMSGLSLAEAARHLRPQLILLFMSGYTADLASDRELARAQPMLEKPFAAADLVRTVAALAGPLQRRKD